MLKMELAKLDFENMKKIVELYDAVVGGKGMKLLNEWNFKDSFDRLRRYRPIQWRFGSQITCYSKLWIRIHPDSIMDRKIFVCFDFDPHTIPGENEKLASELVKKFDQALDQFLKESGLAA